MKRVLGAFTLVAAGVASFLLFDRRIPAAHPTTNILTPEVRRGGELKIEYFIDRYRSCDAKVSRFIVDGALVRTRLNDDTYRFSGPPGPDHYVASWKVPMQSTPGPAKYQVEIKYVCNPLQLKWPIPDILPEQKFTILP